MSFSSSFSMSFSSRFFSLTVSEEFDNWKIKSYLKSRKNISTRLIRSIKYSGGEILKNGEPVRFVDTVKKNDELKIIFPQEKSNFERENIPFEVPFEDEYLLIINKPAGIPVHPTKGHVNGTMTNAISYYMDKKKEEYKIRFVNRLDMDTSGIVLIAKNAFVQDNFVKQVASNNVKKKYLAIVKGIFEKKTGVIDLPIGKKNDDTPLREVSSDGKASKTIYEVVKENLEEKYSLVSLELLTGRTHQIRVHLSYIGRPIVSDILYGKLEEDLIKRQALHAEELTFTHPITEQKLKIKANLPEDFAALKRKLF